MPLSPADGPVVRSRRARASFAGLLVIALPLLCLCLGAKDVWEASEGRPLESAREMRAQGDHLVQYTNGEVDLTKPPLYAWLVGVSFRVFGDSEAAGRLPSVLASIGCLGAVYVLARRRGGARAGFLAGFLLLTTGKFLWQARLAELETLLALGVLWAYVAFDAGLEAEPGPRRARLFAAFFAATGFAFAVKGPVALLLVHPGAVAGALASGRGRVLGSRALLATIPVLPFVSLPWYVAVVLRDRAALDTFLAFARGDNVGHLRDPFYYLGVYPLYGLPAVLAVLPALRLPWTASLDAESRRRLLFPFAALVVTFVLQSALHAKQTHYLIPTVLPMGCVLGGVWLDGLLARARSPRTATALRLAGAAIVVAELVAVGWVIPAQNDAQGAREFFERAGRRLPDGARVGWTVFASHSDYLWYLPERVVGTTGLPELVAGDPAATIARVRTFLTTDGEGYAIVRASEAEALTDVAEVVERDDAVGKKKRGFALVRTRAGSGDRR